MMVDHPGPWWKVEGWAAAGRNCTTFTIWKTGGKPPTGEFFGEGGGGHEGDEGGGGHNGDRGGGGPKTKLMKAMKAMKVVVPQAKKATKVVAPQAKKGVAKAMKVVTPRPRRRRKWWLPMPRRPRPRGDRRGLLASAGSAASGHAALVCF